MRKYKYKLIILFNDVCGRQNNIILCINYYHIIVRCFENFFISNRGKYINKFRHAHRTEVDNSKNYNLANF